jgi:hypothetical protein
MDVINLPALTTGLIGLASMALGALVVLHKEPKIAPRWPGVLGLIIGLAFFGLGLSLL